MTAVKPNKKISYGIARQREAIELIGRRFEQIGTIRQALDEEKSYMTKLPDDPKDAVLIRWKGKEEKIEKPEIWLKIFENVARDGDAVIREIITRRYNNESYWKTCDDLFISTGMYYTHVKDILGYALALAFTLALCLTLGHPFGLCRICNGFYIIGRIFIQVTARGKRR